MPIAAAYLLPGLMLAIACLREGKTPVATLIATVLLGPFVLLVMIAMEVRRHA